MPVFSKYSDREDEALAKKLKAAKQSLSSIQDKRHALKIDLQSAIDSFSAERTSLKDQLFIDEEKICFGDIKGARLGGKEALSEAHPCQGIFKVTG